MTFMRSARRQKILSEKRREKSGLRVLLRIIYPILAVAFIWVFFVVNTKYWNGQDKFGYVYKNVNGDVSVRVLDPKTNESVTLVVPGDTQVDVARNYGTMRIKNVWQLGINEKINGILLAQTVTKNFLTPIFLWSDQDISVLDSLDIINIPKFILAPKNTNIPIGDRLSIALFLVRVKSVDTTTIDLGKSQFLKKTNLSDGQAGYILNGTVSGRLTANFSDSDFSDGNVRVEITDATGNPESANIVGQIVEVMGGKVVSIDRTGEDTNSDCAVLGVNPKVVKKTANLFNCKIIKDKSVFDLEIRLGAGFAKRY